jgi:dTDP-4-amino-4,6-dideoxygalactose transaminase
MKVPFNDLSRIHNELRAQFHNQIDKIIDESSFVLGDSVKIFEQEYARFEGFNYAVGVDNGTNAIELALRALGIKNSDEVIIPAMTFIATAFSVIRVGATPVLVDIKNDSPHLDIDLIEKTITNKTKAIIYVSLHGSAHNLNELIALAKSRNLILILDGAQSQGFKFDSKSMADFFTIMTTSFYPGKNLGALGEGGAILTNNRDLNEKLRIIRDWGATEKYIHDNWGGNFRLHSIQARFLNLKLANLNEYNIQRQRVAKIYFENIKKEFLRAKIFDSQSVYHIFEIKVSDQKSVSNKLSNLGVQSAMHYPKAIHQHKYYESLSNGNRFENSENFASSTLSIPIFPGMKDNEIQHVIDSVNICAIKS